MGKSNIEVDKLSLRNVSSGGDVTKTLSLDTITGEVKTRDGSVLGSINWLDFTPQSPNPSYLIGRMFYDQGENTWTFYNDIEGIGLQLGEELRARLVNDTGATLLDGKAVAVIGAVGASLQVELLDASNFNSSIRGFGLMTHTVVNGNPGYAVRYGAVNDIDTSALTIGQIVYGDPDIPGELTTTRPTQPNYPVRIGICLNSDAVNGVIGVDNLAFNGSDTGINLEGTLNGMVTQTPDVAFSVSGGIIYADITNEAFPTKNLPFVLDFDRYLLNTLSGTGPGGSARVIIPPGGDPSLAQAAQKSWIYVYLNGGNPDIAVSTSKPSVPHAMIGTVVAYDAATTLARGKVHGYRRENNASDSKSEGLTGAYGFTRVVADDARSRGSAWDSGQDATPDVDDLTIQLALSAGVGKQLHYSNLPSFDGLLYQVYNDETNAIVYEEVINLIDIILDANGNTLLGNGFYYTFRFYYKLNSNGIGNDIIVTRPQGHYTDGALAESDALKYTTLLTDTDIEDIVYPLYDMVIGRTGGGGTTVAMYSITSLRSKTPGAGGGSGGAPTGTDDKIRISAADTTNNYLDPKLTITGAFKAIINPGGNEVLDFKVYILYTPDGTAVVLQTDNSGNVGIGSIPLANTKSYTETNTDAGVLLTNFNNAAQNGILIKNPIALNNLGRIIFGTSNIGGNSVQHAEIRSTITQESPLKGNLTFHINTGNLSVEALTVNDDGTITAISDISAGGNVTFNTPIVALVSTTTLNATHKNKIIECSGTFTVTLPDSMPIGYEVDIINVGSGVVTIAATTTLQSKGGNTKLASQYGGASAYHRGSNVWILVGDLSA